MTAAFARAIVRFRWLVAGAWILAAVLAVALLPNLKEAQSGALGDLVPRDAEAIEAELRSSRLFDFPLLSRTVLVERDADGLGADRIARVGLRALDLNQNELPGFDRIGGALPVVNVVGSQPFAREQGTTALTYLLFGSEVGRNERIDLGERLAEQARQGASSDTFVGLTGAIPAREAQAQAIVDALPLVELGTVLLVLTVVGLHFRAPGAPLVCLLAIAVAFLVSVRIVAWLGSRFGISVPAEVEPVIVVLLFGIVTDYAVFMLSRFRRQLAEGHPPEQSIVETTEGLLGIIFTAGIIVAAGSGALVVAELGFFQAFGPGTALAVLIALAVSLTFVPALLAIGGNLVFWPRRPGREVPASAGAEETPDETVRRPVRTRILSVASRRPAATAIACTLLLLAAASGLFQARLGQTLIRGLPEDAAAREAYFAAAEGFTPGIIAPTMILVEAPFVTDERAKLRRLQRLIDRQPGVAEVVGPSEQPLERDLGAVFSSTRNAVRYLMVFDSDPLGAVAIERLNRLRARMPELLDRVGLPDARASFAGDTALAAETVRKANDDLATIAPTTLAVIFVILAVFLRALVAPLYLVAASVLALAASLGLTTYVFQGIFDHGGLTYYVPFAAGVLLVALGSDYNVFLAGRIWQEARVRPLREAVAVAGARAATAITVAGIVLALSFAMLALVPLRPFRELAFTMSVGLLIDAFLVRTLLVPALIALIGAPGGWPGRGLALRRPQPQPRA